MLEFYWAYATYKDLMKFTEVMFADMLDKVFQNKQIIFQGQTLSFKTPWPRIDFAIFPNPYGG